MNENIVKRNNLLAAKVIKGLESRNMSGYYAADKEEALKIALSLIPEGSSIGMGGAMSVHEIGLSDALKKGNYNFIDRDATDDKRGAMLATYDADLTSLGDGRVLQKTGYFPRVSDQQCSKVTPHLHDKENLTLLMNMLILSECCLLIHKGVWN